MYLTEVIGIFKSMFPVAKFRQAITQRICENMNNSVYRLLYDNVPNFMVLL